MTEQYAPLKSYDADDREDGVVDYENDFINGNEKATLESQSKPLSLWISFCCCITLLFTSLNLTSFHLHSAGIAGPSSSMSRSVWLSDANKLYRPNLYIGLERLNASISHMALPKKIDVFPHVFAPVSHTEPDRVFPSDGRSRITFNGLVSPGEPHVIINKHVSMIAQVWVHDHNLERCTIVATIPERSELTAKNRTLTLTGGMVNLDIWALDASAGELDLTKLSWRTRPARTAYISGLSVKEGQESHSTEFDCGPSGTLRIYEFACDGQEEECSVEFWQEQPETKPRMAFTIVQKPSI